VVLGWSSRHTGWVLTKSIVGLVEARRRWGTGMPWDYSSQLAAQPLLVGMAAPAHMKRLRRGSCIGYKVPESVREGYHAVVPRCWEDNAATFSVKICPNPDTRVSGRGAEVI
jgi:hypothetical protein